ncbi:response regulator [Zobellella aerophila]|uniref:Two-component system response regulator AruR n=1 Tax=Zobellella aerophila TaxID=870480 RepID=A0ABP6VPU3_9GAMM
MTTDIKILIVEDEEITRACLVDYFTAENYRVCEADSAEQAEAILAAKDIDLILLDIRLPGKDGLTLTREIRGKSEIGIILVTSKQDDIERIIGLECGADDFITKPFNPREILARAKNLVRRVRSIAANPQTESSPNIKKFDAWTLDLDRRVLINDGGETLSLTDGEFQLLCAFISNSGRTLSRDQLLDQIKNREWVPSDRTVDVLVGRLRKKLQDNPADPKIILTVHGVGYVFTPKAVDLP